MNHNELRNQFPVLKTKVYDKTLVYLDSAATTLKPQNVIDSVNKYYAQTTANVHRGLHFLSELNTDLYEGTRDQVQKLINAKTRQEVIFTKGTTESINLVAASYVRNFLNNGDEILITQMEHHSNIVPWQLAAEAIGAKVRAIPIDDNGDVIMEEYKKLLGPKTKFVSVAYISNALGTVNPVKEMIKLAHHVGAKFMVDAAQAIAHRPVDVQDLDCDFLAFSSHKMFGPTAAGILYGKEALLEQMPPYQGGGDMIDVVTIEKTTYNALPFKFEAGTPAIASVIGLGEAIKFLTSLKFADLMEYEKSILTYGTAKLQDIPGVRLIGTAVEKSCILSFVVKGLHPHDIASITDKEGVALRTGHHCTQPLMKRMNVTATVRASLGIYNTKQDIDLLIQAITKAIKILS
ncbi:MAG: cysteine desulfurase [Bacteriovoracaceae bacterium]|nr:cysteine desulfurase [Bacteriovoracaceae bacterium]